MFAYENQLYEGLTPVEKESLNEDVISAIAEAEEEHLERGSEIVEELKQGDELTNNPNEIGNSLDFDT